MRGMDMESGKGGNSVKEAIKKIMSLLDGAEVGLLKNGGKPSAVSVEVEAKGEPEAEECAACLAGECDDPEHLKDEDVDGLASMVGASGDETKY